MKKEIYFTILLSLFFSLKHSYGQYTAIPDPNFEQALIELGIDSDGQINGQMYTDDAVGVVDLDVNNRNISDLTGIEAFIDLSNLGCTDNHITSLDLSGNLKLKNLICNYNQLTSINVSQNLELLELYCGGNQLSTIDLGNNGLLERLDCYSNNFEDIDLSKLANLQILDCGDNQFVSIDVSNNLQLNEFSCSVNQIQSLDVSSNHLLVNLYCSFNQLTELDVSKNTALEGLDFSWNNLTTIDVSQNPLLIAFGCNNNKFEKLDLSDHHALEYIGCSDNLLTSLNIKNGNNLAITEFYADNNPDLSCIAVDDITYANSNPNWSKDPTAFFSTECISGITLIPDPNFEQALIDLGVDNDGQINGQMSTDDAAGVTILQIGNRIISDLTGIEAFVDLVHLDCAINQLTSLDVSNNVALQFLGCGDNQITSLDLSQNTALVELYCYLNPLNGLDVSANVNLEQLSCRSNQLLSLDLSNITRLTYLECSENNLTSLDLSNNANLEQLYCDKNYLTSLNVSASPNLQVLYCYRNLITMLDFSGVTGLLFFDCSTNRLTELNVNQNHALKYLKCNSNKINELDLTGNSSLESFWCDNNQLTSLDVRNGNNAGIITFSAYYNPSLSCISVDDVAIANANWGKDAATHFSSDCSMDTCDDGIQNGDETGIDCGGSLCEPCPCVHPDLPALMALYYATDGANWTTKWDTANCDICNWYGVDCLNGRVIAIRLVNNNLVGVIPVDLSQLTELQDLWLQLNKLSGEIPVGIRQLNKLRTLYLNGNQLSGSIPSELSSLSELVGLNLNQNQLSDEIPKSMGMLSNLTHLNLAGNKLTGNIPDEIGDLIKLTSLGLSANLLSGPIPLSLGNLHGLLLLYADNNAFSGFVPDTLFQLPVIEEMLLNDNDFIGSVPSNVNSASHLRYLWLQNNQLSGTIPESLGLSTSLQSLNLSNNDLEGCFPANLNNLCGVNVNFSSNSALPNGGDFPSFCLDNTGSCNQCSDGIQNGDETAIDCGGSLCDPCAIDGCTNPASHNYNPDATIDDGSCLTCSDGVQNGDETGIDCGGALCMPCQAVSYCIAKAASNQYEYIKRVQLNTLDNTSGADGGYGDYTGLSTTLTGGQSYAIHLTPGYPGQAYPEGWVVWIDLNGNGSFTDTGERMVTGKATGIFSSTLTVPIVNSRTTRMRIALQYNNSATGSCGSFSYGEVEDYTVFLQAAAGPSCTDGIKNGDETGVDCGGTNCPACPEIMGCTNPASHNYNPQATNDDGSCQTCNDGIQNGDETGVDCGGNKCIPCTVSSYCSAKGLSNQYEYIKQVALNTLDHTSGADGGYGDFTGFSTTVMPGQTYPLKLVPGFAGSAYKEGWKVWIDYNGDGDFVDTGELVYSGSSASAIQSSVTIPSGLNSKSTRMRVAMQYTSLPSGPCTNLSFGEVEDYIVTIQSGVAPTCTDGIQNGNETGIDCGGDCQPCPISGCTDPLAHNYNPAATDDDGSCQTCSDGIQNGDETGVDCGGSLCAPCALMGCTDPTAHNYNPSAVVDDGSCQTCVDGVKNGDETGIDCGGALCAPCALMGCTDPAAHNYNPSAVVDDGSCQTCSDGIQNGDETGVDCGGALCVPCQQVSYCSLKGNSQKYEYIKRVVFAALDHSSGSDGGYGDYTGFTTTVPPGMSYPIQLIPGFAGSSYKEAWRVWIDYNRDGDFNDTGELVFIGTGTSTVSGTVAVPASASSGATRMRVAMRYNQYPSGSCGSLDNGEVEDYTVIIGAGQPPTCNDGIQNGTETGIDCGGTCPPCEESGCTDPNAHNYDPNATVDDGSCQTCEDGIKNGDETGIDCGGALCLPCETSVNYCSSKGNSQQYEYIKQVQFNTLDHTSGSNGGYGDFTAFSTSVQPGQSYTLTLVPGYVSQSYNEGWRLWIDYNGDGDFNDTGELIYSSVRSGTANTTIQVPASSTPGTTRMRVAMQYNAVVGGPCASFSYGEVEDYSVIIVGTNNVNNLETRDELSLAAEVWQIFPNPGSEVLNMQFSHSISGKIELWDMQGRMVQEYELNDLQIVSLNVSSLNAGVYRVMWISPDRAPVIYNWLKL